MTKIAVRRPVLTGVIFAVLFLAGIVSLRQLPLDFFPDISFPTVSIITFYPGAGPEDVEKNVTEIIEDAVSTVPNIEEITSLSQENISSVTVKFAWGTDIPEATNDIRARLDFARFNLPEDIEPPQIFKFDISQFPVVILTAFSEDPAVDLREVFDDEIKDNIERVEGVGQVQLWGGGREKIVKIELSKSLLEGYGLDIFTIVRLLKGENITTPGGDIESGPLSYTLRILGEFKSLKEIENFVIPGKNGALYRLQDIGKVSFSYEDPINYVRANKGSALLFAVMKQSGANTVDVAEKVKKKIGEIDAKLENTEIILVNDLSRFIRTSINNLSRTVLIAGILVILITLFFLRNLGGSVIIAVTIPTSLVVAFILLYAIGASVNLVSLSSLAIAIGMVVDNAVVVLENIFFHRERGETPIESSIFGTQEVGQAIIASTLTTISIFVPIVLAKGFIGVVFRELAFSVAIVLLISLFAAFTLTPVLSSKFLRVKNDKNTEKNRFLKYLEGFYFSFLGFSLKHKILVFAGGTVIFLMGVLLFVTGAVKTEFMPEEDTGIFRGNVLLPPGTPLKVTDRVMKEVEEIIGEDVPALKVFVSRAGRTESGFASVQGIAEGENTGFFMGHLREDRKITSWGVAEMLNHKLKEIPKIKELFVSTGAHERYLFGMGSPIVLEIYGHNIEEGDELARTIKNKISEIEGVTGLRVSRQSGTPELNFSFNREVLKNYGLSPALIGSYIRAYLTGITAGKLRKGGDEYEILLRLDEKSRGSPSILETLTIPVFNSRRVPLSNLGEFVKSEGPMTIERKNKQRVVKIEGEYFGRPLGSIVKDIKKKVSEIKVPENFKVEISGSYEQQRESFSSLFTALIIGIILVYLVMAAQFESFLSPFIIMFAIPFSITGVAFACLVTNTPFSVNSFIGMVMLVGIVVNNSIVLIDYINILRKRGLSLIDAVHEGARRRVRPIIITTATTIFALLPLALSRGQGAETWRPLGISVIGGLLLSSLISLIFVPVFYTTLESIKLRRKNK